MRRLLSTLMLHLLPLRSLWPPTTLTAIADEDPKKMQDDNSDGLAPNRDIGDSSSGRDEVDVP
jgi:hypothetical protein